MPAWSMRFTRLPCERNFEFCVWKMITMITRPTSTGSVPLSPLRARFTKDLP